MVRNPSSPPSPLHTSAPHQARHTTQIPKRGFMRFKKKKRNTPPKASAAGKSHWRVGEKSRPNKGNLTCPDTK